MKITDVNTILIDSYYSLLKSLSYENKLELISKLSKSMKTAKRKEIPLKELYGSWISDHSADELIVELKRARNFSRNREEL